MSAVIFEDDTVKEIFSLMRKAGWESIAPEDKPLRILISDTYEFVRGGVAVKFYAEGEDVLGVKLLASADGNPTFAEIHHAMPRRVLAFLDIMHIVPVTDEWMKWFRDLLWGPQEVDDNG